MNKYYLSFAHQKKANNIKQEKNRKQVQKWNKPMNATYKIYLKLLGQNKNVQKSKEFLRGKGANLQYFSHIENLEGNLTNFLYDIAIIDNSEHVKLLKVIQNGNRGI